jgi:Flp pilus assembly protein TadB
MRKTIFLAAAASIMAFSAAHAEGTSEEESRAYQIARRVAAQENEKDAPSRAAWMGSRVAKNARNLAFFQEEQPPKAAKKHRKAQSN